MVPVVQIQEKPSIADKLLFTLALLAENALIAVPNAMSPRNTVPTMFRIMNVKNQPIENEGV